MRPKSVAILLLALGCGLVAAIGIHEALARRNAEPSGATGDTQSIFVAMTDIGLGDSLTSQVLKLEQWPKDKVPAGAISRIEEVEGRRAGTKLYAGEPILEHRLLGKGASGQGATALIPKGYRVVPVKVDAVTGGASLILPGDRVDVMVRFLRDLGKDIPETMTRTILQDIKVFAVDDCVDLEKEKEGGKSIAAKTVSLLVTPDQAAKLVLAAQSGTVNLVMRSPEDDQQIANAQARPGELFGVSAKSERSKETLVSKPEPSLSEKTKGLLEFLNSMKSKAADTAASMEAKPRETWNIRILKPGNIEEVQFEADPAEVAANPLFGAWKVTTAAGSPAGARSAKEEAKMLVSPAQEPVAPPAEDPSPPNQKLKKDKADKNAN